MPVTRANYPVVPFTPAVQFSTPGTSVVVGSGEYKRLGQGLIWFRMQLACSSIGTGTGTIFYGLPAGMTPVGDQLIMGYDLSVGTPGSIVTGAVSNGNATINAATSVAVTNHTYVVEGTLRIAG